MEKNTNATHPSMSRLERERKVVREELVELASARNSNQPSVINIGGMICEFTPAEAAVEYERRVRYEREITAQIDEAHRDS